MNNNNLFLTLIEPNDDGSSPCDKFHRNFAHTANDAKIIKVDYSMEYHDDDDAVLFDKLYQFFAPKEDDDPHAFNAVEQPDEIYLGGINSTSLMQDIRNTSGQKHTLVKANDMIHMNVSNKVETWTEVVNAFEVELQPNGTKIEQDQMLRLLDVNKDDLSLVGKMNQSFWHDMEESDLLSSFSFYQWENDAAVNNDEVTQRENLSNMDDQPCSCFMLKEPKHQHPESANALEVYATRSGLNGIKNEMIGSVLHDINFQGQNALSSFLDVDHKKSDLIRMVSCDELSKQADMVLESLENLPENSKQSEIVLEIVNLDSIMSVNKEEEKTTEPTHNTACCDILTNLGLEAYLESVNTTAKTAPSGKAKAMKLDGPLAPIRPLSAYNYFFRDERERILHDLKGKQSPDRSLLYTKERQERSLKEHWNQDRTKRRRHRKTHGQISFAQLSKLVSQQWQKLAPEHKAFYNDMSARDWERYRRDLATYNMENGTKCFH
jgi:HMG (high mobility group) box